MPVNTCHSCNYSSVDRQRSAAVRAFFMKSAAQLALLFCIFQFGSGQLPAAEYDVVVYGGTSAGVTAAIQAKRMGKSAIIVCPDKHLGGLTSSGIGWTDTGNKAVIGGLAREFYHRVWRHYQQPEAWKWQRREDYGNRGQ